MRVLITGATGRLGREVARLSTLAGHSVVGLSHRVRSPKFRDAGWVLGDLATGEGVRVAVGDVDAIIHAATDPARHAEVDVEGTARLVRAAREGRVRHFVHVSMAGVDDIPLAYYKAKRTAEQIVMGGGLPYSILRVTQFHHAVERQLQTLGRRAARAAASQGVRRTERRRARSRGAAGALSRRAAARPPR